MSAKNLNAALLPKVDGTRNLHEALKDHSLDFFLMLSSVTTIIGMKGQANYAAGNSFQDYLANYQRNPNTRYISFNLGMIEDSDVIALHPERVPGLLRAGCIPFKVAQFLSLEYTLGPQARQETCKQIIIGVDRESLSQDEQLSTLKNPMFSTMPLVSANQAQIEGPKALKKIEQLLAEVEDPDEVYSIIISGIAKKISALMALDPGEMSLDLPIADLGLDSLIAIELKNWIGGALQASLQTSEILDMASVSALVNIVIRRSALITNKAQQGTSEIRTEDMKESPISNGAGLAIVPTLPQIPLPDLKDTLDLYLTSVIPFCTSEELDRTKRAVQNFLCPRGQGRELQERLVQMAHDPEIDGWQFDLYTDHVYLTCRAPINPFQHFGGGYTVNDDQVTQVELAAIISTAAFDFKQRLEAGELSPDQMNQQVLCMSSLEWIFNTTREPHITKDRVRKFPGNDFMIVLPRSYFQSLID